MATGLLLVGCGIVVFGWASPSPHGFIELFLAVPLMALGLLIAGIGLVISWHIIGGALRTIAVLLICAGLSPLGFLLLLLSG